MSEDHVIISKPVREIADPLLDLVEKTYTSSFPEEERRDFSLVRKLLEEDSRFEMYALLRDGIYVGFITGWQFEGFVYAEHFAIDESARNGGIGAKAMTSFLALHEDPVVLEVEMPQEVLDLYVRTIEECAGKRPPVVYTDTCLNLLFKRTQYQVKYCRLFDRKFDNRKILSAVPDLRFSDVRISLQRCLCALINSRRFKTIGWRNEALLDRVSVEFTPIREVESFKLYMVYLLFRELPLECVKYVINHRYR